MVRAPTTPEQELSLARRSAPRAGSADGFDPWRDDEIFETHRAFIPKPSSQCTLALALGTTTQAGSDFNH
jgi:hypothetical protein